MICLFLINCNKAENKKAKKDFMKQLKQNVINGKRSSYDYLIEYYNNNPSNTYELLPISILVANKYKYENAYLMIYINLVEMENNGKYHDSLFKNLNLGTKQMALFYLNKGSKAQEISSITILENLNRNGWGIPKNTKKADSLLNLEKKLFPGIEKMN